MMSNAIKRMVKRRLVTASLRMKADKVPVLGCAKTECANRRAPIAGNNAEV